MSSRWSPIRMWRVWASAVRTTSTIPPHLAGFGTMQPIALAFKTAREMNPGLASVGVVWNAAEANSEAQVKLAREVCAGMGITLVESTVDNTAGVAEAAGALVARGVDVIWVGGDVTVLTAVDSVIAMARKGGIPVFTVIPPHVKRGALFDVGADYTEVGRLAGNLAGEILSGRKPATVAVENVMPEVLTVNRKAAKDLKANWSFPLPCWSGPRLSSKRMERSIAKWLPRQRHQ